VVVVLGGIYAPLPELAGVDDPPQAASTAPLSNTAPMLALSLVLLDDDSLARPIPLSCCFALFILILLLPLLVPFVGTCSSSPVEYSAADPVIRLGRRHQR